MTARIRTWEMYLAWRHRWRLCGKQEWPWITSQANGKLSSEVGKELEYGVTTTRQIHTNAAKTNSHLGTLAFYPYNSTTHRNHRISCQQLQMVQDYICHLWHTHTPASVELCLSTTSLFVLAWSTLNPEFSSLYTGLETNWLYVYTYTNKWRWWMNEWKNEWTNEWKNKIDKKWTGE